MTGLQKDIEYTVRISALTVNGSGPYSPWLSVQTFVNDLDGRRICKFRS